MLLCKPARSEWHPPPMQQSDQILRFYDNQTSDQPTKELNPDIRHCCPNYSSGGPSINDVHTVLDPLPIVWWGSPFYIFIWANFVPSSLDVNIIYGRDSTSNEIITVDRRVETLKRCRRCHHILRPEFDIARKGRLMHLGPCYEILGFHLLIYLLTRVLIKKGIDHIRFEIWYC